MTDRCCGWRGCCLPRRGRRSRPPSSAGARRSPEIRTPSTPAGRGWPTRWWTSPPVTPNLPPWWSTPAPKCWPERTRRPGRGSQRRRAGSGWRPRASAVWPATGGSSGSSNPGAVPWGSAGGAGPCRVPSSGSSATATGPPAGSPGASGSGGSTPTTWSTGRTEGHEPGQPRAAVPRAPPAHPRGRLADQRAPGDGAPVPRSRWPAAQEERRRPRSDLTAAGLGRGGPDAGQGTIAAEQRQRLEQGR